MGLLVKCVVAKRTSGEKTLFQSLPADLTSCMVSSRSASLPFGYFSYSLVSVVRGAELAPRLQLPLPLTIKTEKDAPLQREQELLPPHHSPATIIQSLAILQHTIRQGHKLMHRPHDHLRPFRRRVRVRHLRRAEHEEVSRPEEARLGGVVYFGAEPSAGILVREGVVDEIVGLVE